MLILSNVISCLVHLSFIHFIYILLIFVIESICLFFNTTYPFQCFLPFLFLLELFSQMVLIIKSLRATEILWNLRIINLVKKGGTFLNRNILILQKLDCFLSNLSFWIKKNIRNQKLDSLLVKWSSFAF